MLEKKPFGKLPDGAEVDIYTLTNKYGMSIKVMTYGATLTSVKTPDRTGKLEEVTLGFDNLDAYVKGHPFFGSTTGRVANRIAKGKFTLDGKDYTLEVNNPPNALHGGKVAFDKRNWKLESSLDGPGEVGVKFLYISKDGEEGYPGELTTHVSYYLTDKNELRIEYLANTNKPSPVNLTNHAYFNLAGATGTENVLNHDIQILGSKYIPTDDTLIPTGKIDPVQGTAFDFTKAQKIGAKINETPAAAKGYDLCYVVDNGGKGLVSCATVHEPKSGRVMEVLTTELGVQFYTGNHLDGSLKGYGGASYPKNFGFCLECMNYPDAVNQPSFPSIILKPGQDYRQTTVYKFSVK